MRIAVLDIGGTAIKSAVWDGKNLLEQREYDTEAQKGGASLMKKAAAILHTYLPFEAIGISTAGQVNTTDGSIYYANENIPGYTGTKIRAILEAEFHVPVAVENDVNAAALGELHYGAGKGTASFLCLTYGTGVGGAIVLEEKVYSGSSFSAGSFGGIVIHPEQMLPGKEFSGCYEKCASATALVREAKKIDPSMTDGRTIFQASDRLEIRNCIDSWIDEIVYGLVSLIHIFNPSLILLGGGVFAQEYLLREVQKRTGRFLSSGFQNVVLRRAMLGNSAGMMGAAWLAERLV